MKRGATGAAITIIISITIMIGIMIVSSMSTMVQHWQRAQPEHHGRHVQGAFYARGEDGPCDAEGERENDEEHDSDDEEKESLKLDAKGAGAKHAGCCLHCPAMKGRRLSGAACSSSAPVRRK